MRIMTAFLVVAALLLVAVNAHADWPARGTIGLYLDDEDGNDLSRAGIVKKGKPFELVVRIDTEVESIAVVFQMTELNLLYPGVFKVSTWKYNETIFGMGVNDIGEYAFAYGSECAPAGGADVLRVGYAHVSGPLPNDLVLYVGGLAPDQIHLRDLRDQPGYIGCAPDDVWALTPEAWEDDSIDPMLIEGVTHTDGMLILNPSISVPVLAESMSTLKAKF